MNHMGAKLDVVAKSLNDRISLHVEQRSAQDQLKNNNDVQLQNTFPGSYDIQHLNPAEAAESNKLPEFVPQGKDNNTNQIQSYVGHRDSPLHHIGSTRWQLEKENINQNKRILEWMGPGLSTPSKLSLQARQASISQGPEIGQLLENSSDSSPQSDILCTGQTSFATAFTSPNTPSFRSAASSSSGSSPRSAIPKGLSNHEQNSGEGLRSDIVSSEQRAGPSHRVSAKINVRRSVTSSRSRTKLVRQRTACRIRTNRTAPIEPYIKDRYRRVLRSWQSSL